MYTVRHLTNVMELLGVQRITVPGGCAHCDSTQTSGYWAGYQSAGIGRLEAELQDNA